MYTDWLLIRRLGWEIEQRFKGAKVRDVGQLEDGRFALALWSRGATELLCVDVFAPTPVVTVEAGELPIAVEPGFVRAAGAALRGATLTAVRTRRGDRLLRLEFGTRSRFGVADGYSLLCELVPRFGNVVLLKGETIVAAAKEFAPSKNAVRSSQAGDVYEAPPLRPGAITPLLPDELAKPLTEEISHTDLYVYRDGGRLVQAHLVPLPQFAHLQAERAPSLLKLLDEGRRTHAQSAQSDRVQKRRRDLTRTLDERERKIHAQQAQTEASIARASGREDLRERGEGIYATLHELPEAEREGAKDEAAGLFARYRKAGASLEHLERRRADLQRALEEVAQLRWDLENVADGDIDDVAQALAGFEPNKRNPQKVQARKRKPLQYATPSGSRILVGRTPLENAEITFRLARPDDLWFHVQNQPGAHVVLQRGDRTPPPSEDLIAAAALAALHSKAKTSPKVTVDYTLRKHVRKRPSAAPGLVFYTNPKSLYVSPGEPDLR